MHFSPFEVHFISPLSLYTSLAIFAHSHNWLAVGSRPRVTPSHGWPTGSRFNNFFTEGKLIGSNSDLGGNWGSSCAAVSNHFSWRGSLLWSVLFLLLQGHAGAYRKHEMDVRMTRKPPLETKKRLPCILIAHRATSSCKWNYYIKGTAVATNACLFISRARLIHCEAQIFDHQLLQSAAFTCYAEEAETTIIT